MTRLNVIATVLVTSAIATAASVSLGSTLAYEGFTGYPSTDGTHPGGQTVIGDNGGTGWGSAWNSGQSDGFLHVVRNSSPLGTYSGYNTSSTPAASQGNYLNLAAGFGSSNPSAVYRFFDTSAGGTNRRGSL